MRKCVVLMLVTVLMVSNLLVILPASLAQTKPATPIFTVEYLGNEWFLKITNQPFTNSVNGAVVCLYYEAQVKRQGVDDQWWPAVNIIVPYVMQTDSQQYTMIPFSVHNNLDVRVRALVGTVIYHPSSVESPAPVPIEFKGVEGDWSETLTVTSDLLMSLFPSNTPTYSNPNPLTPNPLNTDNSGLFGFASWVNVVLVVLFSVIVVLLAVIVMALQTAQQP